MVAVVTMVTVDPEVSNVVRLVEDELTGKAVQDVDTDVVLAAVCETLVTLQFVTSPAG